MSTPGWQQCSWVLFLALLVLFTGGDAADCRAMVCLASVWFLSLLVPQSTSNAPSPNTQSKSSMDAALRQMLKSYPIEDISPFTSDDDEEHSPRRNSNSIEGHVQLDKSNSTSADNKNSPQKQLVVEPAQQLRWQTKLADRATAAVNLEAHYSLPPFTLFDLLADPFQHEKIFDAILSADAELLEDDGGVRRKWRLDYLARWNFWKVSGVCQNRLFMWTDRDSGTITFRLREPGFLKRYEGTWTIKAACGTSMADCYAALAARSSGGSSDDVISRSSSSSSSSSRSSSRSGSRLSSPAGSSCSSPRAGGSSSNSSSIWSLLSMSSGPASAASPTAGDSADSAASAARPASPLASVSVSMGAAPSFPGLTGAVAAVARMQAELQDSVTTTVSNTRNNFANSAAAMQALSQKALAQSPWNGIKFGGAGSSDSSSSKIPAGRQQQQQQLLRPLPTASVITVESYTSPKLTPPYPLNQALKVQSKGQIADMLEGLVAAAAARLSVMPLHAV